MVLPSCNEEDNPIDETSDYLEVTLNGKTYREKIPNWGYSYFDATDKDSSGKPISVNNVIVDLYEKYGFSFFPMIAYYSKKTDLMAAKPGKYLHTNNIWKTGGVSTCENFTLATDLEIFEYGTYYELTSGTHQVNSIKEIGDNVQIEGVFDGVYKCDENNDKRSIQGKYRITLHTHNSNNPLD